MDPSNNNIRKPQRNGASDSSKNKRRVSTQASNRTVNVSAGGGAPQPMTPGAAAKYIQQATAQAAAAVSSNASGTREVKISFGPSRPPTGPGSNSNTHSNSAAAAAAAAMSFGSLDLNALKETAAAAAVAQRSGKTTGVDGLPCSEAEMKALMSMFVEIMGMSVDANGNPTTGKPTASSSGKRDSSNNMKNNPMFMFGLANPTNASGPPPGWPDQESLAAATAGLFADGASWDAIRRSYGAAYHSGGDYEDDDDDDDSIPDLDDMREIFGKAAAASSNNAQKSTYDSNSNTASNNIDPDDWESLEQVAVEDALEVQDRARKAAKKREKKQRRKQKQKEEAAEKAAETAQKKREKSILSWRSRVVSACQSGELAKLEALLQESQLDKLNTSTSEKSTTASEKPLSWAKSTILPHLEFLLPNSIAKNRSQLERGKETRNRLATYILTMDLALAFTPLRSGRTALHTACFQGDQPFVELVLDRLAQYLKQTPSSPKEISADIPQLIRRDCLNMRCDDSGWSPLHYAAVSGSIDVLEALLRAGCSTSTITDEMHTWRESDGCGVSPRELVQSIHAGTYESVIESHGVALQEMQHAFLGNQNDRRIFLHVLDKVAKRLRDVEANGYSSPNLNELSSSLDTAETEEAEALNTPTESAAARKRKKKKKKKQAQKEAGDVSKDSEAISNAVVSVPLSSAKEEPAEEDPLLTALLGMGFVKEQISAAAKACGGTNRATADDLVTWILGQDAEGSAANVTSSDDLEAQANDSIEVNERTTVKSKVADEGRRAAEEAREKEEVVKRLAAKREEQRRRNRDWNNREQARQAKAKVAHVMPPSAHRTTATQGLSAIIPAINGSDVGSLQTGIPIAALSGTHLHKISPFAMSTTLNSAAPPPRPVASASPFLTQVPNINAGAEFPALSQARAPSTRAQPSTARDLPVPVGSMINSHNSFPPIGDDDRTVSSFGSNRGLSLSSAPFVPGGATSGTPTLPHVPPPGFMQSGAPGIAPKANVELLHKELYIEEDTDHVGEIRATAKAFVPKSSKSFTPAPEAQPLIPAPVDQVPAMSSFGPPLGDPLTSSLPHASSVLDTPDDQPPGFLGSARSRPSASSSFLGSSIPMAYDQVPAETPVSEDMSASSRIGSSFAGVRRLEGPSLGIPPMELGIRQQQIPAGATSSLLSSTFTNGPPVGGDSIWGGTAAQAPSLVGLPPLSYGGVNTEDTKDGNPFNSFTGNQAAPSSWGAAAGGSIW